VADESRRSVAPSREPDRFPENPGTSAADAQHIIGYTFRRLDLLEEALTHKSHANELRQKESKDNERLEFLGDAVLTLVISEHLAQSFPAHTEGELSKLKAQLVSEVSLAQAARRLDLGRLLRLGRGEELTKGREKSSLLANAFEAILAAVYVDGGLEPARALVLRMLGAELSDLGGLESAVLGQDYKTQVQEWCQKQFESLPQYVTVRESGPDHQKTFEVQLKVRGEVWGVGIGRSKKEAEQIAAKQALQRVANGEEPVHPINVDENRRG
jgi:ribonuclease-3